MCGNRSRYLAGRPIFYTFVWWPKSDVVASEAFTNNMSSLGKDTEEVLRSAGEFAAHVREYAQLQLDYWRLDLAERLAKVASTLLSLLAVAMLLLFGLFMATMALALFLGQRWGSYALGFLAVAGLYVLLAAFLIVFKEPLLTTPLLSRILGAFFSSSAEANNHEP